MKEDNRIFNFDNDPELYELATAGAKLGYLMHGVDSCCTGGDSTANKYCVEISSFIHKLNSLTKEERSEIEESELYAFADKLDYICSKTPEDDELADLYTKDLIEYVNKLVKGE